MARGVRRALPGARIALLPLSDGGEGTLEIIRARGVIRRRTVTGPLGCRVRARYATLPGRTGVVEMAEAAGLTLVPPSRRDPGRATTTGVGELIAAAAARGCRRVVVTLGGSATVDGGGGMAQALGARLLDAAGHPIPPGGAGLLRLERIDPRPLRDWRRRTRVTVTGATDVRNPLLGARGAARVFGPQKGASPAQVKMLERGLARLARRCRRDLGVDPARVPGAGAAGGLGAGLVAFLGAKLEPGADWIFRLTRVAERLKRADLVLTGEGNLDAQTGMGKLVSRIATLARRHGVPVVAFAGRVRLAPREVAALGLAGAYGIAEGRISKEESLRRASSLLEARVFRAFSCSTRRVRKS